MDVFTLWSLLWWSRLCLSRLCLFDVVDVDVVELGVFSEGDILSMLLNVDVWCDGTKVWEFVEGPLSASA